MGDNSHTIILLQAGPARATRTFLDFETVPQAVDAICRQFEMKLKDLNPHVRNITYDVADLYAYLDAMPDISGLVYNAQLNAYVPHNKDWLKKKIFDHLKKQAGR